MARLALMVAGSVLLAACGGSRDVQKPVPERRASRTPAPSAAPARPGSAPRGDAGRLRPVIAGWADALRRSDVELAITYFDLPAVVAQGRAFRLTTRAELRIFNAGLPCGARLRGVRRDGRYVVGTFVLTERPGQTCDAPGSSARVAFLIRGRKIVEWRQVPGAPAAPRGPDGPGTDPPGRPRAPSDARPV